MLGRELQKRNVNAEFLSYPNTQEYKLTSRFISALLMFPPWKNVYQIRSMATDIAGAAFDDSIVATESSNRQIQLRSEQLLESLKDMFRREYVSN